MSQDKKLTKLEALRLCISVAFLKHCKEIFGRHVFQYNNITTELDINVISIALIRNIEEAYILAKGASVGEEATIHIYKKMVEINDPINGSIDDVSLTQFGIEIVSELFEQFIVLIETDQLQLAKPTLH
ncbi:hypothetical protein A9G13_07555 [Gilliamella sp. wkB178]|uniref:hypothetical protein n=1 Tax=Gilliamella sp. wkB178 TaxID=3120259 RepID=UPI00080E337F|nr:hypothetical protein [Gilliamella apicola]OCG08043.1 hypothetical protein A9G13_07555 [Gilliamella apicola]